MKQDNMSAGTPAIQNMKIRSGLLLQWVAIVIMVCGTGLQAQPLWQIGKTDRSAAEFALAKNEYTQFLRHFGSPDRAFYAGLSKPADDWPCVLPGPLDPWAGGAQNGSWDQMNTLPIGFVLEATPASGTCRFTVGTCASKGPQMRVTVNGAIH